MPATAGRVRMPANNRVHSSAALQTHGIWQSAIGYDPYAPNKDDSKNPSNQVVASAEPEGENAYASFQGLLALARITGSNADEARGACKKCGRVGHLTFQCKNFLSLKESKEKDPEAMLQTAVLNGLDKLKGGKVNGKKEAESEESEEEEEESESSDSDVDSEMERIIAERYGKKVSSKPKKSSEKKKKKNDEDDESDSDYGERKKRGRSKKRSGKKRGSSDSEDENESRRKRRKEKRRRRDESSDEDDQHRHHRKRKSRKEKRRRRSHRSSDDSESSDEFDNSGKRHRRKSRREDDDSSSDDYRVGRVAKRSDERSRKRHHEYDE